MIRYTANGTPCEDDEEHVLVDYCDLQGWKHTHFSNETYTTSWKQKMKMKYLGVHSGIPDHLVIVPRDNGSIVPVYIEMKRQKDGTISDSQFDWITALKLAGQYATVCEGGKEAVAYLEAIKKSDIAVIQKFDDRFEQKFQRRQKAIQKRNQTIF